MEKKKSAYKNGKVDKSVTSLLRRDDFIYTKLKEIYNLLHRCFSKKMISYTVKTRNTILVIIIERNTEED